MAGWDTRRFLVRGPDGRRLYRRDTWQVRNKIRRWYVSIDVPGSSLETQQEVARQLMRVGESLALLDRLVVNLREDGELDVRGLSVRFPAGSGAEYLVTVRAEAGGVQVVAFHSAYTLGETLRGLYNRMAKSKLKWKEDEYGNK